MHWERWRGRELIIRLPQRSSLKRSYLEDKNQMEGLSISGTMTEKGGKSLLKVKEVTAMQECAFKIMMIYALLGPRSIALSSVGIVRVGWNSRTGVNPCSSLHLSQETEVLRMFGFKPLFPKTYCRRLKIPNTVTVCAFHKAPRVKLPDWVI